VYPHEHLDVDEIILLVVLMTLIRPTLFDDYVWFSFRVINIKPEISFLSLDLGWWLSTLSHIFFSFFLSFTFVILRFMDWVHFSNLSSNFKTRPLINLQQTFLLHFNATSKFTKSSVTTFQSHTFVQVVCTPSQPK